MNRPPNPAAARTQSSPREWHGRAALDVLRELGSTAEGLSASEAARRLALQGPNEITAAKPAGALQMVLAQFRGLIIWVLIAAGIVSGILGELVDCIAILAIVLLNAGIGFTLEFRADRSIAALKKWSAPRANVRREGRVLTIPAVEIVTGDILVLEAGDLIAADACVLEAASLRCMEAALTGESVPVAKVNHVLPPGTVPLGDRKNMVFTGTAVTAGTGRAVVVSVAMHTELGRIAVLIEEAGAETKTPLQKKLDTVGRLLVWATLGVVALLFALGLMRGSNAVDLFMTSVSLAVAAVPEGLPAVVTVALALGVLRMSRRRALVRKLPAVETLGATSVICTDKTGTLTVGEMTVRKLQIAGLEFEVDGEGYGPAGGVRPAATATMDPTRTAALRELATHLVACNNAHLVEEAGVWKVIGDPTEGALLAAGRKAGVDREQLDREWPKQHENPFDSDRKRSSMIRRMPDGHQRAFVNGAPDALLPLCTHLLTREGVRLMTEGDRHEILARNAAMGHQALRVLGTAHRDLSPPPTSPAGIPPTHPPAVDVAAPLGPASVERDLVFVGLAGMYDPPRPEVRTAIGRCHAAGIRVVMITGDHPVTASAVAREIGLTTDEPKVISGVEMDQLSDAQLRERVLGTSVFARVTAEHKLRIVRAWRANEAVVAMTGDGVNDAPAIKAADIGIAMGRAGTEVTRQASDMIVTDDNFATIVAAVEEGRGIYDNIRKTLQYLLAGNTGEVLLMTLAVVAGYPAPLLPIHLLWINLVTDGLPALCLATDPVDPAVMKRRPRHRSQQITNRHFVRTTALTGLLTAGVALTAYLHGIQSGTVEQARTAAFAVLVYAELLRAFGSRSATRPLWQVRLLSNPNLVIVVVMSFALQIWSHHNVWLGRFLQTSSVPFLQELELIALGSIPMLVLEVWKMVSLRNGPAKPARHPTHHESEPSLHPLPP